MQRNYPRTFSPADDQDQEGFKFENVWPTFLTRECAHAHERVIAIVGFSLGRLVRSVVNFRACAVNEF